MSPRSCDHDGSRTSAEPAARQLPAGPSALDRGTRLPVEKPTKPFPLTVTAGSAKPASSTGRGIRPLPWAGVATSSSAIRRSRPRCSTPVIVQHAGQFALGVV